MGPVLVTGAAGFIGFHLTRRLVADGVDVVGVDAFVGPSAALCRERAEVLGPGVVREVDLTCRRQTRILFETVRPTCVIHLAARTGVRDSVDDPAPYIDGNVVAFGNVLEGCRAVGSEHLLYASSSSVYGDGAVPMAEDAPAAEPVSLYAATKRANELMAVSYAHAHDLRSTGLRFFSVYGPWGRPDMVLWLFADALLKQKTLTLYGDPVRDMTFVDDVVEAIARLMRSSGAGHRVVNVGTGTTVSLPQVVDALQGALGCSGEVRRGDARRGDARVTQADMSRLRELIDYVPGTTFAVGLAAFAAWFLQRNGGIQGHTTVPCPGTAETFGDTARVLPAGIRP